MADLNSPITINDIIEKANNPLPDQTGNSGKFLTTDGTDESWGDVYLANLKDVSLTSQAEDDLLVWDNTAQKWKNAQKKYCETNPSMLPSVNGLCSWQVTHNLGTKDICVAVYDLFTNKGILFTDERVSENRVDIEFVSNTNIPLNTYRVVILA